jgi:hypothetical protein
MKVRGWPPLQFGAQYAQMFGETRVIEIIGRARVLAKLVQLVVDF